MQARSGLAEERGDSRDPAASWGSLEGVVVSTEFMPTRRRPARNSLYSKRRPNLPSRLARAAMFVLYRAVLRQVSRVAPQPVQSGFGCDLAMHWLYSFMQTLASPVAGADAAEVVATGAEVAAADVEAGAEVVGADGKMEKSRAWKAQKERTHQMFEMGVVMRMQVEQGMPGLCW